MSLKEDSVYRTSASPPDESNGRKRRLDSITNATLEDGSASDDEPIVSLRKKASGSNPADSARVSKSTSAKKQATKPDASTSTKKKRSRKTSKKGNDASVQRVQSLIQALPRRSLEELVLSSFQNSVISMKQIEDAFPPDTQWKKDAMNRKSPLKITKSHSRTNTGEFDAIDDEIMGMILMNLDVKTRVMICNSICTGWRSFRESMPFLWNEMTIDNILSNPSYRGKLFCLRRDLERKNLTIYACIFIC